MDYSSEGHKDSPSRDGERKEMSYTRSFHRDDVNRGERSGGGRDYGRGRSSYPHRKTFSALPASALRYPGPASRDSSSQQLVYCVARNVHKLDMTLSRFLLLSFCHG